jgi:hypothetical protein
MRELGERHAVGQSVCRSTRVLAAVGRTNDAAVLLACFDARSDEPGPGERWVQRMNDEARELLAAGLDDASHAAATQAGGRMTLDDGLAFALAAVG